MVTKFFFCKMAQVGRTFHVAVFDEEVGREMAIDYVYGSDGIDGYIAESLRFGLNLKFPHYRTVAAPHEIENPVGVQPVVLHHFRHFEAADSAEVAAR